MTPYSHWPANIRVFYPDVWERTKHLSAVKAFRTHYPEVDAKGLSPAQAMALVAELKLEPQG